MLKSLTALLFTGLLMGIGQTGAAAPIDDILARWQYNDPAASEMFFTAALPDFEKARDVAGTAILKTQIARTHSLRGHFDEAHRLLDEVEPLISDDMILPRCHYLLERGRTYNSAGKKEQAAPLFFDAFEIALRSGFEAPAVDAAHMLAITGDGDLALRWNQIAFAIAQTSKDPGAQRWLGSLHNNLGWTYFDKGELKRAPGHFESALAFREARGETRRANIARWTIARTYRALGEEDKALEIQEALLIAAAGDEGQLGYIHEELGELYLEREKGKASQHFRQAYDILSRDQWLVENESARIERLGQLAAPAGTSK